MKKVAILAKPYEDSERIDFIVNYNHNLGFRIEETETELQAWDFDDKEKLEQRKQQVRAVRNQYLEQTDKFMLADFPIADAELENYKEYRQYLRDYTKDDGWYSQNPMTFEEWKNSAKTVEETNSSGTEEVI